MIRRLILSINLIFILHFFCCGNSLLNSVSEIEQKLNVTILYDSIVQDSWQSVTYEISKDSFQLKNYFELLNREYSKYPNCYFQNAGIKTIVVGIKLNYDGQNRAAVPDPYRSTLYFAMDGAYGNYTEIYLVHVLHHELNHCAEYALWQSMNYTYQEWDKLNPRFFNYLGGSIVAYNDLSIDWYSMNHPKKGFINLYSTVAEEEDRSELVALIMTDEETKYLFQYSQKDKKLKKKISLTLDFLNEISHSTDNYWTNKMSGNI